MPTFIEVANPGTLNINQVNWSNYTLRQHIAEAQLSNQDQNLTRITFEAASTFGATITKAYIGMAASSGDPYDYETTPTQVTFDGGNSGVAISAGQQEVSDEISFTIQSGKNLIISFHIATLTNDDLRGRTSLTGWNNYWKLGDDAATVNATGYSTSSNSVFGVALVEGAQSDTGIWLPRTIIIT